MPETIVANTLAAYAGRNQVEQNYVAHSLRADGFDAGEDGTGRGTPLVPVAFNWQQGGDTALGTARSGVPPLRAEQTLAVAYQCQGNNVGEAGTLRGGNGNHSGGVPFVVNGNSRTEVGENQALPLRADQGSGGRQAVAQAMAVRRLTPVECERLQGFPDGYTAIPYRGKQVADSPRYRALGNSMAVPVMRWIGRRIQLVEEVAPC